MWSLFCRADTFPVFEGRFGVYGGGTCLAMPKTICTSESRTRLLCSNEDLVYWRRNPPCSAEDDQRAVHLVIESWFRGY